MRHFWGFLFGAVLLGAFLLTALAPLFGWWLPRGVSTYSDHIDTLYYWILGVTGFFFVLTEAILVYNMIRFAGEPGRKAEFSHGNHRLEMLWTVIPGVILFLLAVLQINVWADIKYPSHLQVKIEKDPEQFLQMEVTTRQWEYRIRYASPERMAGWADKASAKALEDYSHRLPERRDDIYAVNDIHTWKGQKVLIYLKTRDVNHALFIPAIRVKQDSMSGRTIPLWFEATESNTKRDGNQWLDGYSPGGVNEASYIWDMVCTHYCGTRHSLMRGKLYVHPTKDDFLAWLKTAQEDSHRRQPAAP